MSLPPQRRGIFIITALILYSMSSLAQTEQTVNWSRDDILPDFQHLSPEASSLGVYGNVNFNHYTSEFSLNL